MTGRAPTRISAPEGGPVDRPGDDETPSHAVAALLVARDELAAVKATCTQLETRLAAIAEVIEPRRDAVPSRLAPRPLAPPAPAAEPALAGPVFVSRLETPPGRSKTHRRIRAGSVAVGLLATAGSLMVGEAVITVVWQEPVSAVIAQKRQASLETELAALNVELPRVAPSSTPRPKASPEQRVRRLAVAARTKLKPGKAIGRLRAPRLGGSWVIVDGTDTSDLRSGPGRYETSSLPGLPGTTAIAGHRTTYGAPFRKIDRLRTGDKITMEMPYGTVEYRVEGHRVVDPSDTRALRDINRPRLVLTACTPIYSAAQRWVVIARQVAVRPRTMS